VRDGNVWTSAGVTAGIDLALALVAEDHGAPAAAAVARQLVVYLQRSGGHAQVSAMLAVQALDSEPVRDLLSWLPEHLDEDLSVPVLARRLNLSERQFRRVFKAQVGVTAADHVEAMRLEAACRLLETTQSSIGHIAVTCGFGGAETMKPHLPPSPRHLPRRAPTPLRCCRCGCHPAYWWKLTPAMISAIRTSATSQSTAAQNGGHHLVLAT
jgi:transcriptional regulator GlxA family with amidase domain